MNGAGLASLVSGFQQGYSFMDDMQRKKKNDARLDKEDARADKADARTEKEFARKEQGWKKADDYDAERMSLIDEFYPAPQKEAQPAQPAAAAAAAGVMPSSQEATPTATAPTAGTPSMQPAAPMQASRPAAIAQQGVPQAAPVAKPDPMMSLNKTLDFAMKNALLDVKHGKLDGPGLLALQKVVDGMKNEKADEAITLMHQGRYDEAMAAFNSSGDHTGSKIVSVKDEMFKAGKEEVPTKVVTVQDANGNKRVINTAQTFYQRQPMEKVLAQAQADRQIAEAARHNKASEGIQGMNAQTSRISALSSAAHSAGSLKLQQDAFKKQSLLGQVEQIEAVTGPLKPEERKALGMQLAGLTKGDKGDKEYGKFVNDVVMEGVKAGTIKPEDAVKAQNRLMQGRQVMEAEATIASELAGSVGNPSEYAEKYAMAIKVAPPARLAEMGFKPPAAIKKGPAAKAAAQGVPPVSAAAGPEPEKFVDGIPGYVTKEWAAWDNANRAAQASKNMQGVRLPGMAIPTR